MDVPRCDSPPSIFVRVGEREKRTIDIDIVNLNKRRKKYKREKD